MQTEEQIKEQIAAAIKSISEELKGPMPNLERALLVADRKELRERLARMVAPTSAPLKLKGTGEAA